LAVFDHGQGTSIVLLHGNPTSSYPWRNVVAELEGLGNDRARFDRDGRFRKAEVLR
jgi:pimeloyl-ACP methyl ester carboxylesterase